MNLRTMLLLIAALLAAGIVAFAILFVLGILSPLFYTICSTGISILLVFTTFHFIYLYLRKDKR